MVLIDTNIAVHLRDGSRQTTLRLADLDATPAMSMISLVELQGGMGTEPAAARRRHARLGELLQDVQLLDLDRPVVEVYGGLIATIGFSRPRILDRLIAATAIVHDLTLVTINAPDFRDIPGLKLEVWPAPGQ